jgi:hypothetical protein
MRLLVSINTIIRFGMVALKVGNEKTEQVKISAQEVFDGTLKKF